MVRIARLLFWLTMTTVDGALHGSFDLVVPDEWGRLWEWRVRFCCWTFEGWMGVADD